MIYFLNSFNIVEISDQSFYAILLCYRQYKYLHFFYYKTLELVVCFYNISMWLFRKLLPCYFRKFKENLARKFTLQHVIRYFSRLTFYFLELFKLYKSAKHMKLFIHVLYSFI